jgi:branched-chain amino acid transport system permease protein
MVFLVLFFQKKNTLAWDLLMENYLLAMSVFAGLYALMALGLNVVFGLGGLINLGLAGFYAIGGYVSALLVLKAGWPMLAGWVAASLACAAAGVVLALITARLKGDYLAIVTLGFAEVIRLIASNELWLTNGTDGISNIPGPGRGVLSPLQFNLLYAAIVWTLVLVVALLLGRLSASPFGRVLRAIREDEMIAAVAGKPVLRFKVQAFAVGSAVMGLAGALYAHFNAYVAPDAFQALVTIYVVLALIAGGTGRMAGAVLGSVLVVFLTEGTRFAGGWVPGLSPVQVAALREASIGIALILVLYVRPQGILPERTRVLSVTSAPA